MSHWDSATRIPPIVINHCFYEIFVSFNRTLDKHTLHQIWPWKIALGVSNTPHAWLFISHSNQADIIIDYPNNYIFCLLTCLLFVPPDYKVCGGRNYFCFIHHGIPTPRTVASYYPFPCFPSQWNSQTELCIFTLLPDTCLAHIL